MVVATTLFRLVTCLLYTSDAADERSSVDLGGRRIIKKKKQNINECLFTTQEVTQSECVHDPKL